MSDANSSPVSNRSQVWIAILICIAGAGIWWALQDGSENASEAVDLIDGELEDPDGQAVGRAGTPELAASGQEPTPATQPSHEVRDVVAPLRMAVVSDATGAPIESFEVRVAHRPGTGGATHPAVERAVNSPEGRVTVELPWRGVGLCRFPLWALLPSSRSQAPARGPSPCAYERQLYFVGSCVIRRGGESKAPRSASASAMRPPVPVVGAHPWSRVRSHARMGHSVCASRAGHPTMSQPLWLASCRIRGSCLLVRAWNCALLPVRRSEGGSCPPEMSRRSSGRKSAGIRSVRS